MDTEIWRVELPFVTWRLVRRRQVVVAGELKYSYIPILQYKSNDPNDEHWLEPKTVSAQSAIALVNAAKGITLSEGVE